jgi:hypothetical protein
LRALLDLRLDPKRPQHGDRPSQLRRGESHLFV